MDRICRRATMPVCSLTPATSIPTAKTSCCPKAGRELMADNKTRSEAALLVLVVFLLGAIAGGTATHLWGDRVWGKQPAPGQASREQIVNRMTNELKLTPEQAQQFGAIV